MNRRERRMTSKRLGILQYQQKLPRKQKFELMRENIAAGNVAHEEFLREVERQQNRTQDEIDSEAINFIANNLVNYKKIALIDALAEAEKIYYKRQTKTKEEQA